jgi:hypothetical protein
MPTKGNPVVKVRVEPELRDKYAKACEALRLGSMSDDLRAHVLAVVAEHEGADMVITPDPETVREIAEDAIQSTASGSPAERIESALIASGVAGPVLSERFDTWTLAVAVEYERQERS